MPIFRLRHVKMSLCAYVDSEGPDQHAPVQSDQEIHYLLIEPLDNTVTPSLQ